MASGLIGNEVSRMGLRVRVPCPPLLSQFTESIIMPAGTTTIATNSKDGILTVYFLQPRVVDETQLEQLAQDILAELDKTSEERLILDFQKVQFMSSSMLGKLVQIHKKCKEFKVKLKLSSIDGEILQVFKITKLDKLFDIESDEVAARKAFLKRGLFG